ncbi:MAG: hypothetical protein WBQ89_03925, partial [Candidatus Acidiferrum sp.]
MPRVTRQLRTDTKFTGKRYCAHPYLRDGLYTMWRRVRLSVAFLALASPLVGQQSSVPPQSPAKLSTRSDLVLVPVIVTDKAGNPVSSLAKDAFTVEENGKRRSLSLFEETRTE